MKWVTRARPKTDRIACPWLIRRYIDPEAEFVFVPADQVLDVAAREGGYSFDAAGATYSHRRHPGCMGCARGNQHHSYQRSPFVPAPALSRVQQSEGRAANSVLTWCCCPACQTYSFPETAMT